MALTGGLHLSTAREGERSSGPAELGGPAAVLGLGLVGPRGKKRKKEKDRLGWAGKREWVRVFIYFVFFSIPFLLFPFKLLLKTFSKFSKKNF
jgi:hypothetical protein